MTELKFVSKTPHQPAWRLPILIVGDSRNIRNTHWQQEQAAQPRRDLIRALRLIQWAVPLLMALIGVGYTLFEHIRHTSDPLWPWPTVAGVVVLGVAGPMLAWVSLRWTIQTTRSHMSSEEQLATLNGLIVTASQSLGLDTRIATVLEQTIEALDAEAGMLFCQEDGLPGLRLVAHRGISPEMACAERQLNPGRCLCGQAASTRQVLFAGDVGTDHRCTSDLCICEGFRSVVCAPLEVKGQLVGLMQLASPDVNHFTETHREFLTVVAGQISVSIENARLYNTIQSLNVTLEQKVNQRTVELEEARWALVEKARQLQRLLSESYRIQEDTQARIAQDMHDTVTQIIIGALYETQAAREALFDDPDRAAESLTHAQQLMTEAETEIRRVIYGLYPPVLDMMGLVTAVKRYALTYQTTFGVECSIEVAGQLHRLPRTTELAIYRIILAALHNVAAHAQADRATVTFRFEGDELSIVVQDNGHGFDPQSVLSMPGEHMGLVSMMERAKSLGADLNIASKVGAGTCIKMILPTPSYLTSDCQQPVSA